MDQKANGHSNEGFLGDDWFPDCTVPELFDDESVYSWCARFHRLNGCYESRSTSRILFGHPKAGLRHDIPGHMGAFQLRTQNALGDSRELLRKRTLFCFYFPFLSVDVEDELLNRLISGDNTVVRKQLGLERTGLAQVAPLKYCPECVAQQVRMHGVAWWKTSQQLPTVFLCQTHGEWLGESVANQYRGVFLEFQTPLACLQREAPERHDLSPSDRAQLVSLANWGDHLQKSACPRFSEASLRHCYLLMAKLRGWLSFDGSVRMQRVRDEFVGQYGGILHLFGSDFFGDLNGVNAGFLAYMFRQLPSRRYPLKHVLLMNLMFGTFDEFLEISQQVRNIYSVGGERAVNEMLRDSQATLIKLVSGNGLSASRAAAEVGVSASCAVKFLKKNEVSERSQRPHIVGTAKEQKLTEMLRRGLGRKEIATTVGVRPEFIKDYLAKRPELKIIWADAQRVRLLQMHRSQLLNMLTQHSDLPIKSIRRLPSNGFQWLYINDRDWLQEVLPAIWKR